MEVTQFDPELRGQGQRGLEPKGQIEFTHPNQCQGYQSRCWSHLPHDSIHSNFYFSFAYDGYDPFVALLTRNTFDPYDTMLSRLGVMQNVVRTAKPDKGVKNLQETLADGTPAIVLAGTDTLLYTAPLTVSNGAN